MHTQQEVPKPKEQANGSMHLVLSFVFLVNAGMINFQRAFVEALLGSTVTWIALGVGYSAAAYWLCRWLIDVRNAQRASQ